MQLDQHRIVIRQRSFVDLLDLALCVIRRYAWPLSVAFAAGVAPVMCFNAWLLADVAEDVSETPFFFNAILEIPWRYLWYTTLLIILETPLATAPMTLFLGRALFTDRPRPRQVAQELWRSLPQLLWYQLVVRALFVPWVVTWPLLFAVWPYLGEVILLERNPMWGRRSKRMTTFRRARVLHGPNQADLFVRWIAALALGVSLFVSLWITLWVVGAMLLTDWTWGGQAFTLCLPLAAWVVVGYFAVARFLAYLDLRIRCEGWEVELLMRAEAARLTRQLT